MNARHAGEEHGVIGVAICAPGMNTAVAVWAESNNESRVIRSAIAQPSDMVRLKIGTSVFACERCQRLAAFAVVSCASQHVVTKVAATLVNVTRCACSRSHRRNRCNAPRQISTEDGTKLPHRILELYTKVMGGL